MCTAPPASVSTASTSTPLAATKPAPGSFSTVTTKVWDSPMPLVSVPVIPIRASTQTLVASWLAVTLASAPVLMLNVRPAAETETLAVPVVVPVDGELNTTTHCPLASVPSSQVEVPSGSSSTADAAPSLSDRLTVGVRPETGCSPVPSPSSTFTVTVNVCGALTRFAPSPVMSIVASTQVLTASWVAVVVASVDVETGMSSLAPVGPAEIVAVAVPVWVPVPDELNDTVQGPRPAPVLAVVQESSAIGSVPLPSANATVTSTPAALTRPLLSPLSTHAVTVNS